MAAVDIRQRGTPENQQSVGKSVWDIIYILWMCIYCYSSARCGYLLLAPRIRLFAINKVPK